MTELFAGPLGPVIIFLLRICDVSLATTRMLLTMRDARAVVPIIGFFESLIWLLAVGTAVQNLSSVWHVLGYTTGFASGTLAGLWIEGKLALGLATIRVFSRDVATGRRVAAALREAGHGATEVAGVGREGPVDVILTVVRRRQIPAVVRQVESVDRDAFISVEEPRAIRRGWMFGESRG
jgi:uncharacterized protein YebE (UPF0316 family)